MRTLRAVCLVLALVALPCVSAWAVDVKMTGDARVHGTLFLQRNYTGWSADATQTEDAFTIWQRFRLRTDFIASQDLKFRLSMRVNNTAWGNNTLTVDNPAVSIQVWQAYLQFKWPGTDAEITVGYQDWALPISSPGLFNTNPVFGGTRSAAAVLDLPLASQVKLLGGFSRFIDSNRDFDPTTTQQADELDGYFLTLPISLDGFSATPWGMAAVVGSDINFLTGVGLANSSVGQTLATNLLSAGTVVAPFGLRNGQNLYWWVGGAFALTALDPFKFYADVMYGQGNASDRGKNRRAGLFLDVAAEYTGLDMLTPQVAFWYSTGEDSSTTNGSERMPSIVGYWGPSTSFLFDSSQAYNRSVMGVNNVGNWGVSLSLNKMRFLPDLTHRLTVTYVRGTNSSRGLRDANALTGTGVYVQMGRDLTSAEYLIAVNFDHQYDIYENLALIVEAGWSHGQFQTSVWGRRLVNQAASADPVKVAVGLRYLF